MIFCSLDFRFPLGFPLCGPSLSAFRLSFLRFPPVSAGGRKKTLWDAEDLLAPARATNCEDLTQKVLDFHLEFKCFPRFNVINLNFVKASAPCKEMPVGCVRMCVFNAGTWLSACACVCLFVCVRVCVRVRVRVRVCV